MADVRGVTRASAAAGSRVPSEGRTSQKTGFRPQRTMACVVETNVKGVVITSDPAGSLRARRAASSAKWPLAKRQTSRQPSCSRRAASNSSCLGPILVTMQLSHRGRISLQNSSNGGSVVRVTSRRFSFIGISFEDYGTEYEPCKIAYEGGWLSGSAPGYRHLVHQAY